MIIKALKKALTSIDADISYQHLYKEMQRTVSANLSMLQQSYLQELINDVSSTAQEVEDNFKNLSITLNPDYPLMLFLGAADSWHEMSLDTTRHRVFSQMHDIVKKHLSHSYHLYYTIYNIQHVVWFCQPIKVMEGSGNIDYLNKKMLIDVKETLEPIQRACRHLLPMTFSFSLTKTLVDWNELGMVYRKLDTILRRKPYLSKEAILSGEKQRPSTDLYNSSSFPDDESQGIHDEQTVRKALHILNKMSLFLSNGLKTEFYHSFDRLFAVILDAEHLSEAFERELYYRVLLLFTTYLNQSNEYRAVSEYIDIEALYDYHKQYNWLSIKDVFFRISEQIFALRRKHSINSTNRIIFAVETYIRDHLESDTSLTAIADYIHLSPSYLSRMYKQYRGHSVSDYLIELRITRAKELLLRPDMKIYEVARAVGYDNPSYFTQFFKRHCRVSPAEFREHRGTV